MRQLAIDAISEIIWGNRGCEVQPGWYHTSRYKDVLILMYEQVPRDPAAMPKKPKWLHSGYDYRNPMDVFKFFMTYDWDILSDQIVFELLLLTVRRQAVQM